MLDNEENQYEVKGYQEGKRYPVLPTSPEEVQALLLLNPNKSAQNQSAPSPSKLNPHLYVQEG